ncbi:MAG TPA: hypothetical protein VNR59_13165, partial [Gaiellaceae bacterium]|nr:hypothetical protein [Gaiellaceae bacterium]
LPPGLRLPLLPAGRPRWVREDAFRTGSDLDGAVVRDEAAGDRLVKLVFVEQLRLRARRPTLGR